jgi:hypothetical protein
MAIQWVYNTYYTRRLYYRHIHLRIMTHDLDWQRVNQQDHRTSYLMRVTPACDMIGRQ